MDTDEFFRLIAKSQEIHPGRNRLEPGLSDAELLAWSWPRPGMKLPHDLLSFLQRCNGFHLYVIDNFQSRGFIELLPLREMVYQPVA